MTGFLLAAVVMTLVAVTLVAYPLLRDPSGRAPVAGVVSAVVIPAVVTLLYATVSSYPWSAGPGGLPGGPVADSADIIALKDKLARQPDDADGWVRLGDAYIAEERFADARDAFRQALDRDAGDDDIRLSFAEASILSDQNAMAGEAGRIVDEVLARDPVNAKALWYGGIAALERGDTATARSRWSKLLELSPPPQVRKIIEEQLAQLDGASRPGPAAPAPGQESTKIAVRISVKPELAGRIRPGASLFLFARAPGAAGPPLAVVRRNSADLPLELEISDADSMVPGQSMGGLAEVRLTARMANDGEALPAPGDVFGESTWSPASAADVPLQILMDQVVQ